ncbi:hypothetical protein D3C85_1558540 [compost metagenome]
MQIDRLGEALADQGRTDDLAGLVPDQTAAGLIRKGDLSHARHRKRIGDAQNAGEQGDHHNRRTDVVQHQNVAFTLAATRPS